MTQGIQAPNVPTPVNPNIVYAPATSVASPSSGLGTDTIIAVCAGIVGTLALGCVVDHVIDKSVNKKLYNRGGILKTLDEMVGHQPSLITDHKSGEHVVDLPNSAHMKIDQLKGALLKSNVGVDKQLLDEFNALSPDKQEANIARLTDGHTLVHLGSDEPGELFKRTFSTRNGLK